MTQLHRERSGGWIARKAIPEAISQEYSRLYGPKFEAKFRLPATVPEREAKALFAEWHAEVETRFQRLRDRAEGRPSDLTQRQALALVGKWYTAFVRDHEDEPGKADGWEVTEAQLTDAIQSTAEAYSSEAGPFDWEGHSKARAAVAIAVNRCLALDDFLAREGLVLTAEGMKTLGLSATEACRVRLSQARPRDHPL